MVVNFLQMFFFALSGILLTIKDNKGMVVNFQKGLGKPSYRVLLKG